MAKLFANSEDSDQMLHSAASDLGITVCQLPFYRSPDYNGLKKNFYECRCSLHHKLGQRETPEADKLSQFFVVFFYVTHCL